MSIPGTGGPTLSDVLMGKFSHSQQARVRSTKRGQPNQSTRRLVTRTRPATKQTRSFTTVQQIGRNIRPVWTVLVLLWQLLWRLIWYSVRLSLKLLAGAIRMLRRYPAVGLLTAWAILVGMAIAATTAIMNPEASIDLKAPARAGSAGGVSPALPPLASSPGPLPTLEPAAPESRNSVAPVVRSRPPVSHSPAAAVSIILISCGAGCLFLSRCLKPRSTPASLRPDLVGRPQPQPIQPSAAPSTAFTPVLTPASLAPAAPEPAPDLTFEFPLPEQLEAPVYSGPLLAADETDSEPLDPEASNAANAANPDSITVVPTVVPDAQDHPLDWVEPSLADSLDLRQRRPLSYWLGGLG